MKRLAILWLTLFGACWFTQAVVSALFFQRPLTGTAALVVLAVVPLAQALVIGWMTRPGTPTRALTPGPSPDPALPPSPGEGNGTNTDRTRTSTDDKDNVHSL